jgi:hypothetical protein
MSRVRAFAQVEAQEEEQAAGDAGYEAVAEETGNFGEGQMEEAEEAAEEADPYAD